MNYGFNIGGVSAAGAYAAGASPYGCDGRREREGQDSAPRALRGGSFLNDQRLVRCSFRSDSDPYYRRSGIGFRVVLSPLL